MFEQNPTKMWTHVKIFYANTWVPYPHTSNGSACHGFPSLWAMYRDSNSRYVDAWKKKREERSFIQLLMSLSTLVSTYQQPSSQKKKPLKGNTVHFCACEVLSLGLLYAEFWAAIWEGDGLCVLCCWCYFLPIFRASNWTNYSIEAFHFLAQHQFLLSPRLSQQGLWSRYVNTHSLPGKNIACNFHLNRVLKGAIQGLGANKTPDGIAQLGRCISPISEVVQQYD